ncbi:MAG: TolC family protein [Bacteroidales bacterium]|nr:TolC family protein [Bacteroidales bacterium]
MKRSIILITTIIIVCTGFTQAQNKQIWSLQKCIQYAQENNLSIKQSALNADYAKNQYNQKKYNLLPNLNGSSSYTVQMGQVRNQTTYQINNVTTSFSSFSISSTTPLYQGLTLRNTIKKYNVDWQSAVKDVEKARNDLSLNIVALYLQILFDKELLEAARSQFEVVNLQVERTTMLVKSGSVPEGRLLEIKAQASSEAMDVTSLENNLALSILDLAQALDLESTEGFDIETPVIEDVSEYFLSDPNQAYLYSVSTKPEIASSELSLKSSEYDLKIARGSLWPQLSFSTGWETSVARLKGDSDFNFSQSFKENDNIYFGLNLSIPIFNRFSVRTDIKNAQIGISNAQYELDKQKQTLRKEIQQASADALAALRKYQAGKSAVDSYQESFRYTENRFSVGLINSVDYNVAKSELIKAQSDFIQAKYAYILRTKILDFYMGKPIVL